MTSLHSKLRNLILPSVLISALALGVGLLSAVSFAGRGVKPHKLTIIFTGDDLGTVKPCG